MRILLTNDDGIEAPGIRALESTAQSLFPDAKIFTVAPMEAQSGCGHRVTVEHPIQVHQKDHNSWAVDGTPADCTRIALAELVPEADLVFAGINEGGNMGVDIFMSGTVAAAREAAFMGIPAIALSQYYDRETGIDWDRTISWSESCLQSLINEKKILEQSPIDRSPTCPPAPLFNINFPRHPRSLPIPDHVFCQVDNHPLLIDYKPKDLEDPARPSSFHYIGDYHQRPRSPDADVSVCMSGRIAITQLTL